MNLLDALQPLRRKLPLLITSLLFVVVAAGSWSAYHHLERALILAASDRVGSAAQRLAILVDDQMTRARLDEQRIAALPPVVRFATTRRAGDREGAVVALDRERTAGSQGPVSITLMDADRAPLLTVGRTRPTPVVTVPATRSQGSDAPRRGWVGAFIANGDCPEARSARRVWLTNASTPRTFETNRLLPSRNRSSASRAEHPIDDSTSQLC